MREKPEACEGCPYERRGKGFVPGGGQRDAAICLVGEAPGSEEVTEGRPFIGAAGRELNDHLVHAGIERDACYVTNAIRCQPPFGTKPQELARWGRECFNRHGARELRGLSANVYALLGSVPLAVYGGESGITKWAGSILTRELEGVRRKFIPILHPAATMAWQRSRKLRGVARKFYRRLADQSNSTETPDLREDFRASPTFDEARLFLAGIVKNKETVAYDIETTGLSIYGCDVLCISFCTGDTSLCVPIYNADGVEFWEREEFTELVSLMYGIFNDPDIELITQNGTFDESVLRLRGFDFQGKRTDTCYLHHTLFAELPHNLGFLGSIYTLTPYWKDDIKGDRGGTSSTREEDSVFRTYNCRDSHVTFSAGNAMRREAMAKGRLEFYEQYVAPLIPAVADMQAAGVLCDMGKRQKFSESMNEQCEALAERLFAIRGTAFNPRSKDELASILFEEMGYTPLSTTPILKRGQVDANTIRFLYRTTTSDSDREFLGVLKEFNELDKKRGTFIDNIRPDSDGRVRASWSIHGTRTGRLACKGPDYQNVPDGLCREVYVPGSQCTLLGLDYSSFEQWINALYSEDNALEALLSEGKNIHCQTAADFLNIEYSEALDRHLADDVEFDKIYVTMKNYRYGTNYGASAQTVLDSMIARSDDPPDLIDIERIQLNDVARFPRVQETKNAIADRVKTTRLLRNGVGRERYFLSPPDKIVTEAYNFPIQSLAADIINQAHVEIFRALSPYSVVAQIHDSFLIECASGDVLDTITTVKRIMERPFTFQTWWENTVTHSFAIDVKASTRSWGELKEFRL